MLTATRSAMTAEVTGCAAMALRDLVLTWVIEILSAALHKGQL